MPKSLYCAQRQFIDYLYGRIDTKNNITKAALSLSFSYIEIQLLIFYMSYIRQILRFN